MPYKDRLLFLFLDNSNQGLFLGIKDFTHSLPLARNSDFSLVVMGKAGEGSIGCGLGDSYQVISVLMLV